MKKRFLFLFVSVFLLIQPALPAQVDAIGELKRDIQDIKERVIRLEEGQKNLEKRVDALEARMDKRFDELKGFMLWGFGITFSGMFMLVGFILWDRRTTLAPVAKETKELRELIELLQKDDQAVKTILKEYAKENDALSKILNKAALL
jgi:chaperonin cofactor prefoldin